MIGLTERSEPSGSASGYSPPFEEKGNYMPELVYGGAKRHETDVWGVAVRKLKKNGRELPVYGGSKKKGRHMVEKEVGEVEIEKKFEKQGGKSRKSAVARHRASKKKMTECRR